MDGAGFAMLRRQGDRGQGAGQNGANNVNLNATCCTSEAVAGHKGVPARRCRGGVFKKYRNEKPVLSSQRNGVAVADVAVDCGRVSQVISVTNVGGEEQCNSVQRKCNVKSTVKTCWYHAVLPTDRLVWLNTKLGY